MKKLIVAALVICLISVLPMSTFAATVEESSNSDSVNTNINTSISPTYTVTIPANVTVDFNALSTDFGEIKVDAAQIHPNKCIKVTLNTDKKMENSIDDTKVIPYRIMAGNQEFTFGIYLAANDSTALTINIAQSDWDKAYAGSYSDTVTFTVLYTDIAS